MWNYYFNRKYFGNYMIFVCSNLAAVASILSMTIFSESFNCSPNWSKIGARCLQCPNHGASFRRKIFLIRFYAFTYRVSQIYLHISVLPQSSNLTSGSSWLSQCCFNFPFKNFWRPEFKRTFLSDFISLMIRIFFSEFIYCFQYF